MIARVRTVAFQGVEAIPVDVEVMIAPGKVGIQIVGLADKAVAESRERVQSALHASGLAMPPKRVTINLAPADLPKEGSHYDLPIALGLMAALGAIPPGELSGYAVLGELSLDGSIVAVNGVLPAAMAANAVGLGLICPHACGSEAAWASADMRIVAARNIIQIANHFRGTQILERPTPVSRAASASPLDMAHIKGQDEARRALEVAAAGGHNLLFCGPPGSGKSMLAQRLPSILPPLSPRELLEVSMISSIAGELAEGRLSTSRPFRAPHHSASMAAMIGGGTKARPGEVSMAHQGILFLDELPEFSPAVLDSLRQPIESGEAVVARVNHRITYPARFQLVAAMNPCRCGMAGEPGHVCARGPRCQSDYQARVSGPFMDRIDLRMTVPAVTVTDLMVQRSSEASADIAKRVAAARQLQHRRYSAMGLAEGYVNARCSAAEIEAAAALDADGRAMMGAAADRLRLSARAFHRVLKVARTLADLDGEEPVGRRHLAEALAYRVGSQATTAA